MRVAPLLEEAPEPVEDTASRHSFKNIIIESGEEAGAAEIKKPRSLFRTRG